MLYSATGYLYTLVEDLEDEGYETICLFQDHVKRIRSNILKCHILIAFGIKFLIENYT